MGKRKDKICVYTCITGKYDNIHEIENKEIGVDYLLFTNNKEIKSNTWEIIYIEDDCLDNQRLSRKIKMLGHEIIDKNYDISVWMDASVTFKKSIGEFVSKYFDSDKAPFSAFVHHARKCIYEEAKACIKYNKDTKENIDKHIEFLKKEKFPPNMGLYEMTVFIKEHNNSKVRDTMKLWFDMVCNHSKRDQLSFVYCIWKTGMKINPIELNVFDNLWFSWSKHNFSKEIKEYRVYFGNEDNYKIESDVRGEYKVIDNKYIIDIKVPVNTDKVKVELTKVPCVKYKNISIDKIDENDFQVINSIKYNDNKIFYNDLSIIVINKCFNKNDRFYLEIVFEKMALDDIYNFTDYLGYNITKLNDLNYKREKEIECLKKKNLELKNKLENILNSKGWKALEKARSIRNKFRK